MRVRPRVKHFNLAFYVSGNALIGTTLEVEYNRENLDGSTEYLGWIKGAIAAWNKSKGYLVNFEDGDQEWLPSVEEKDVRLVFL